MGILAQLLGIEQSTADMTALSGITLEDGTHLSWTQIAEMTSTGEGVKILAAIDKAIAMSQASDEADMY